MARGFFALCLVVGLGFLVAAFSAGRHEPARLAMEDKNSAMWLVLLAAAGVEHALLQGERVEVESLIERLEERVPELELAIYDPRGIGVYGITAHPTPLPEVTQAIETGEPVTVTVGTGEGERLRVVMPLANSEGCVGCHGASSPTRGAMAVTLSTADASRARMEILKRRASFTSYVVLGVLLIFAAVLFFFRPRPIDSDSDSDSDSESDSDSGSAQHG